MAEWRGRVLEDLGDFEFVASFAAALAEDRVNVHTAYAEAEIACGRSDAVISALEGLTNEHPYREPLWAQLIIAYYIAERQSDALDAYRRLKTALSEDLGIEPGPTIRALHGRILRQEVLDCKASRTHRGLRRREHPRSAYHGDGPDHRGAPSCAVGSGLPPDRGGDSDRPPSGQ